ncbi:MAG: hypothetical protein KF760_18845 [Candidatus Eremiobacteraeota bacterium]|nr:hypothetical protein [Candidatus Eremiobacteraeota bacterium]MCW5868457.1 hypothetical protein [Candidatus Eremiobacteraeota bacterium]
MSSSSCEDAVYTALETVKNIPRSASPESSLTRDLGLESIDIVDLFFEIEQATGTTIEINQLLSQAQAKSSGRRFEDISIQDVVDFLASHH